MQVFMLFSHRTTKTFYTRLSRNMTSKKEEDINIGITLKVRFTKELKKKKTPDFFALYHYIFYLGFCFRFRFRFATLLNTFV